MTDLLTVDHAAERLSIDLLNLVDILAVGDIHPAEPSGITGPEVWKRHEEIRLSETDIELIKGEIRRRRFVDFEIDYADVYRRSDKPGARGLAFGAGWTGILTTYADGLRDLQTRGFNCQLRWGKEKFGALRLYADYILAAEKEVIDLHRAAHRESLVTCQECGQPARLRFGHSICLTLCDRHKHIVGEPDSTRDGIILDLDAWTRDQGDVTE
ncbi:hypothetical protein [uncultured Agrobacterium sp.]|uniref:hypothetical protein n=1 Tax=uncultured Agrobacterium sp. TaxID=157277 RepID=UPI0025844A57|nr:hypothetical protein [uncultured Agrobacterium sp.]